MTWKGRTTPHPLPTLCTIRAREITTVVTVAPTHNPTPSVIPCRVRAPGAWNLPAVATASACCGVCARTRRFPDRSQGMTRKRGASPHPLPTLCTIGARKITTAVTVAPTHTGDLKLLLPKMHNELKSPIDRIISPFGLINAPPNDQQAA